MIMKKKYMAPATTIEFVEFQSMVCASITGVGGDAGVTPGEGSVPTVGDSRRRRNVWDDEDDSF